MIRHGLGGRLTSYAVLRVLKEDRSRKFSVAIARGKHLFPFRTEKLSLSAPMVLGLKGPGRVGRRRLISTQGPSDRASLRRSGTPRAGSSSRRPAVVADSGTVPITGASGHTRSRMSVFA